jgi:hypothetical protein
MYNMNGLDAGIPRHKAYEIPRGLLRALFTATARVAT